MIKLIWKHAVIMHEAKRFTNTVEPWFNETEGTSLFFLKIGILGNRGKLYSKWSPRDFKLLL